MEERNHRKERVGVVVSDKMQKSIVVAIKDREQHPLYGKFVKKTKKFHVHPGIIVGRLQHKKVLPFTAHSNLIEKIELFMV